MSREGQCYIRVNTGRNNANDVDLNRNFPDQFHDGKDRESLLRNREPVSYISMYTDLKALHDVQPWTEVVY